MKIFSPLAVGVLALLVATVVTQPLQAESRNWTQATSGRTISGEFVKVEGENVHIRKAGGGIIPVPMKMLSQGDRDFIAAQAKPTKPTAGEGDGKPVTVELHEMHICCGSCVRRIEESVAELEGVKVDVDRKEGVVTVDAPDLKAAQGTIDTIAAAGFYGKSDSHDVDFKGKGVKGDKAKIVTVTGVHLCCKGCVTAVNKAVTAVEGVEDLTAKNKAESFEVTGDFSPSDVLRNLRKAGMNGVITTGASQ